MVAIRASALILALLVIGACARCGSTSTAEYQATPWPEANRLFEGDARWIGGDAAYTLDLGDDRILWLFGDSFIATSAARLRSEATMVRNSVAIQRGRDPSRAQLTYHWNDNAPAAPTAFFKRPDANHWLWPLGAVRIGARALLFMSRIKAKSGGLGFEGVDWQARLINNPDADPPDWNVSELMAPSNAWRIFVGTAAVVHEGFVYAYGLQEPSHDLFLMRFAVADAEQGDLSKGAWWCGGAKYAPDCVPERLFRNAAAELSVHREPDGRWMMVESLGFGATELAVRHAPELTGPWSAPRPVFRPPESDWNKVLVYAGKAHPGLVGSDIVVTYVANSLDFGTLVDDQRYYYPRFVRLKRSAQ